MQAPDAVPARPTHHAVPTPRQLHVDLPPVAMRKELAELYFEYIHDQFHSIYHRASFMDDLLDNQIPPVVLFAIFALSARFSINAAFAGADPRGRGEIYRVASESLLNIRDISPAAVQAYLLLGAYAAASGEIETENLYYGLAGRTSLLLDLPNIEGSGPIERETNIRTWWAICMVDVWSSTAVKLPRIMPIDNSLPLPNDTYFRPMFAHMDRSPSDLYSVSDSALLVEMIKLNGILSRIIDFNQACVSEHLDGASLERRIQDLTRDLDAWLENLPFAMRDTPDNFKIYASRGMGRIFAAVYLGYYHYGQLLNYQFLSSSLETPTESMFYASACKEHAARLCSLVYRSHATPGSEVMYSAVSHILVIASTVQIHTLLFSGDEREIRISRARLERNFEILLKLRTYWPSVDGAMSRLRAFHQTCLRSKDTSFVLDRWLLRFLIQFAPHMELEPRDNDPEYQALLALSRQSPLSTSSGLSV
jgi:hypothetical protein